MTDYKKQYERIQQNTARVNEKIKSKELLSENECLSLINEIKMLPDSEIIPKIKEGKALNIDELLKEFNTYADSSKSKLEEMLAVISNGKIPSITDRQELDHVIECLCDKYETVCVAAERELQEDEIPEVGSPIGVFYEALKNSKSAQLKNQLNEVQTILKRYISVQSLVANLSLALEPFQKDAESLLTRINQGEIDSVEEINDEIAGPQLFMKALEFDDLNTDEGNDMLDSLEEKFSYPSRVTRGLSSKSYFVSEDAFAYEQETDNKVIESVDVDSALDVSEERDDIDNNELCSGESYSELNDSGITEDVSVSKDVVENIDEISEDKPDSEFVISLKKSEIIKDSKDFGILSSEISTAETKKLSASVFSNDLRKGNVKAFKSIIQQIDRFTLISPEVLDLRYKMPADVAEGSLDFLRKKGYLRKYKVIPGGEFYCSSPRLEKALTYKEASKFVEVKQHRTEDVGELIEDRASSALARTAFVGLYVYSAKHYRGIDEKNYSSNNVLYTEAFIYRTYGELNPDDCEFIIGVFWTEYKECDDFLKGLEDLLEKSKKVSRFIVSALSVDVANSFIRALTKCGYDKLKYAATYIYIPENKQFYDFKTRKEIEAYEIWPGLADKIDTESIEENTKEDVPVKGKEPPVNSEVVHESEIAVKSEESIMVTSSIKEPVEKRIVENELNYENTVYHFFAERKYYCASAYAKAISNKNKSFGSLYDLIAYAVNDPMKHCIYSADGVFDIVPDVHNYFSESLMIAIGIRTFFSNQVRYDYNIKAFYDAIKSYPVLSEHPALSSVVYKLVEFKDEQKKGMDSYADYHAKSIAQLDDEIRKVQREAKLFYESTILAKKSEKASQRRFLETKKLLFSVNGEIGQYIKTVADNDKEMQPLVVDFLQTNFIKEGNVLSEDNIDFDMLWNYIMVYWDQAGEKMMYKLRADLMSHLRSNIVNVTTKALQIMIKWCLVVDQASNQAEDDGSIAYKKIRKPLISDIQEAIQSILAELSNGENAIDRRAGFEAIRFTLDELLRCIEGTYEEAERKFFYAPFLFTDDVLLDESFCPDLELRSADVSKLLPETRILEHSNKTLMEPVARLKEILDDGGDDYGSARLIVEYLKATAPDIIVSGYAKNIDDGEEYVKETAELKKTQFIGDLELAYVSGQIDNSNSAEDKKEKILQIVDAWYEWACDSSNYGFFAKVMDSYLEEIRIAAKSREKDLLAQLDAFKATSISGLSTDAKEKKITKIQIAINDQNYTVAEDLLAHVSQPDVDHEDIIEEHFLKDFIDDYNDYYKAVAKSQMSFAMLVNNRTHNKEGRGGKRLADNWLPGGSTLGRERLVNLLTGFGFNVNSDSVQQQSQIGRFENYTVKTIPAKNGKRENYTHPIAAFGSGASQEGFRVVCLNGKYDAAGLIDVMKQIGNAKHTMILLDYALDKPERRILARKSKSELGDKLFVVIDRTVMMYMVKNYDETKATRMLMSLIVPFGYYQPYVWESSNVMPPEIFMGRKHELERIESPTGANIVYGGRQLGKSALLKKAKEDIDKDENGNRAVLVDIKHLNYKDAAKKIGHALFDEGVLTEDIETTDWDDLSRAIKKRLQSEKNRIQYLLLLLDESDAFIESCEEINYRPFDALKDIQSIGSGRFKFVIAGLRNIVRFKRDAALGNNSVLTHLESMTVKPFQTNEARELMEIPLNYLGLVFPKENESLITLILASTNYFPGLIQMYCAKLLSAMRNKDYAGYDEADTPIYEVSEEHIKKVLADPEFMEQIKEKFIITLKLDEDNYYYLIALLMAYMYHNNGYNDGYSSNDVKETGKTLGIAKIASLDDDKLSAFMEELKELNVLRSTDNSRYLFTRFSFFQMMGTSSDVDEKLMEYMED